MTVSPAVPLPSMERAEVVVPAPGPGPGNWAGAASAVVADGAYWLAYRRRRPLPDGRGVAVVIARSEDGVRFTDVVEVDRDAFGSESFERPVLVPVPGVGWRLYLSCATWDSKHWWVDSLTAPTVEGLVEGERRVVLPGDARTAVKDPVISHDPGGAEPWRMWLCCHPLTEPGHEDRMTTRYLVSEDGLAWVDRGEVLRGRAGAWDERGARVVAVLDDQPLTVLYDGRPDAASNWHEQTGIATWDGERLVPQGDAPVATSPFSDGALRYATAVRTPEGAIRYYFEAARDDGAHDLYTCVA